MKIAVIGSGIGGLATACELAKDGHTVEVFEKNDQAGGILNAPNIDGKSFPWPSQICLPEVVERLFQYCGQDKSPLEWEAGRLQYIFPDGSKIELNEDVSNNADQISTLNAPDAHRFLKFIERAERIFHRFESVINSPLADWQDVRKLRLLDFLKMDLFATVNDRVEQEFQDARFRQLFRHLANVFGSDPWQAPALFNVWSYLQLGKAREIKGGVLRLADTLQNLAESFGVRFHFKSVVRGISASQSKAVGIVFDGGTEDFDLVVSNLDYVQTHKNLLSDTVIPPTQKEKLNIGNPSTSAFVVLIEVDGSYGSLPRRSVYFGNNQRKEFQTIIHDGLFSQDPTISLLRQEVNPEINGAEHHLFTIWAKAPSVRSSPMTSEQAEAYADLLVFKLAERGVRGLQAATLHRTIISPDDFKHRWGLHNGGFNRPASNHRFDIFLRPRARSPFLKNLYLTGGSYHPGGGITGALLSARHACALIRRDFGINLEM